MATKKRNTKAKRDPYKGIPREERNYIAFAIDAMKSSGKKPVTPKQAWERIKAGREQQAAENVEKQRKDVADQRARLQTDASEALQEGLRKLGDVRDVLTAVEQGHSTYLQHEALCAMAHSHMVEVCSEMEQALCDLGVIKPADSGWFVNGKLACRMPKESGVQHG